MSAARSFVARTARAFRQLSSFGALVLAVRVLWLASADGLSHARAKAPESHVGESPTPAEALEDASRRKSPNRPDIDELKQLAGAAEGRPTDEESAAGPAPRLRRILVDLGPERSEVYVGGSHVGRTPYGGQISCMLGEKLKIQVLPPRGVPVSREVVCQGDTVVVRE